MISTKLLAPTLTACALAISLSLVGCGKKDDAKTQAAQQKMPPAEVGVIVAQPQSVEQKVELSGRTTAYQISEVRPQASGVVLKRLFAEGSYVREGQALYQIDARSNTASADTARATLRRQQANLNALRVKERRYHALVNSNAVSKQEYDDMLSQVKLAEADVAASQSELRNAEINLGYSTIRAPISGQTGRSSVTVGALVNANQADALLTIQQLDPIYVDINQSSAELLKLRQQLSVGKLDRSNNTTVKLKLEDGSTYPIQGRLTFSDASVDPDTGSVTLRAVFPNPKNLLLPGMYATAQIAQGIIPNAYLIPQVAITRLPTGQAIAMVVNSKNVVESRPIQTVAAQGADWIVSQGLKSGEKVIVEGTAKVKEGDTVNPKPFNSKASAATPAAKP